MGFTFHLTSVPSKCHQDLGFVLGFCSNWRLLHLKGLPPWIELSPTRSPSQGNWSASSELSCHRTQQLRLNKGGPSKGHFSSCTILRQCLFTEQKQQGSCWKFGKQTCQRAFYASFKIIFKQFSGCKLKKGEIMWLSFHKCQIPNS